jgi:hypothetical protein
VIGDSQPARTCGVVVTASSPTARAPRIVKWPHASPRGRLLPNRADHLPFRLTTSNPVVSAVPPHVRLAFPFSRLGSPFVELDGCGTLAARCSPVPRRCKHWTSERNRPHRRGCSAAAAQRSEPIGAPQSPARRCPPEEPGARIIGKSKLHPTLGPVRRHRRHDCQRWPKITSVGRGQQSE